MGSHSSFLVHPVGRLFVLPLIALSACFPALTEHEHEFSGTVGDIEEGKEPHLLRVRVHGQGPYGFLKSDAVTVDKERHFHVILKDYYCEPVTPVVPIEWLHTLTWPLPLGWMPLVGPILIGSKTGPLKDIEVELLSGDEMLLIVKAEPKMSHVHRYKVGYEFGRIPGH